MRIQFVYFFPTILALMFGILIGTVFMFWLMRARIAAASDATAAEGKIDVARLEQQTTLMAEELKRERGTTAEHKTLATNYISQLTAARLECAQLGERASRIGLLEARNGELTANERELRAELARVNANLEAEQRLSVEKLALLEKAKERLSDAFRALANDILEERANQFAKQSNANLGIILEPLKTKLDQFQAKVEEVYVKEGQARAALGEQVRHLTLLNQQVSEDAQGLTNALTGSSRMQGSWGEKILAQLLEASGLCEGRNYSLRESYLWDDGHRGQPDVVIHLPGERHLIVDSKVSLVAYKQYVNTTDEAVRAEAIKHHLDSLRKHIKELSDKDYQKLCGIASLDFVIMFVPIESAFAEAIRHDDNLWEESWDKNILLVSPGTLLFVLRTVANLWRQEDQAHNVMEIAACGADLYDKLVAFVEDLDKVRDKIRGASESCESARKKLSVGQRSVIGQADSLKKMGVKPSKSLPLALVESATG